MRDASPRLSAATGAADDAYREVARRDALTWLAEQLRWERTLAALRSDIRHQAAQAA